jgi:NAD(P)-dependent dehydrogenase (short-subunit alcohol dehydrogenase family)
MDPATPTVDLTGQVAIVTGGGRGLGNVMAQTLAEAGAVIAVVARSEDQLAQTVSVIRQAGGKAIGVTADVTNREAVEQMVITVERQLGAVDLLVNNAGVIGTPGPIWETDPDEWWRVIEINLRGVFLCARSVLPGMIKRKRGRIINVSSVAGIVSIPYTTAYSASKAALLRFTDILAADTRNYGIAVFAIRPGTVRTAMTEYLINAPPAQKWLPWFRAIFQEGRDAPPELCGMLVTFLASGQADELSGRFIQVTDDLGDLVKRAAQIQQDDLYTLRLRQ